MVLLRKIKGEFSSILTISLKMAKIDGGNPLIARN